MNLNEAPSYYDEALGWAEHYLPNFLVESCKKKIADDAEYLYKYSKDVEYCNIEDAVKQALIDDGIYSQGETFDFA